MIRVNLDVAWDKRFENFHVVVHLCITTSDRKYKSFYVLLLPIENINLFRSIVEIKYISFFIFFFYKHLMLLFQICSYLFIKIE